MFLNFPRSEYYQWDTGQVALLLSSAADITEVHMWNDRIGGRAMVQPIYAGENGRYVEIPDVLFQRDGRIVCWAVTSDPHGASTAIDYDEVLVNARAKPTDYAPGTVETLYYKALLAELADLEESWQKVTEEDLPDLLKVIEELKSAAKNGEFDGFSPIVTVVPGEGEDTVVITDKEGDKSFSVPKSADKIIFTEAVKTAYAVGNIKLENGVGVMAQKGESVADLFRNVWFKVLQPTVTQPSLSVSFTAAAREVGTTIHPAYYSTFSDGKYSFGPATGVAVTEWRISDTEGNSSADWIGTYDVLLTDETAYQLTVEVDHSAGVAPYTNEGVASEEVAGIEAGTIIWKSPVVKGYRNSFYGAFTQADLDTFRGLTQSQTIRTLTKSEKALQNGSSFTVTIPTGAVRVVIAYPATLRDVTSIKDVNGMNAEIKSSFMPSMVDVEGAKGYTAIPYKVYTLDYAEAVETANTYTVVI